MEAFEKLSGEIDNEITSTTKVSLGKIRRERPFWWPGMMVTVVSIC